MSNPMVYYCSELPLIEPQYVGRNKEPVARLFAFQERHKHEKTGSATIAVLRDGRAVLTNISNNASLAFIEEIGKSFPRLSWSLRIEGAAICSVSRPTASARYEFIPADQRELYREVLSKFPTGNHLDKPPINSLADSVKRNGDGYLLTVYDVMRRTRKVASDESRAIIYLRWAYGMSIGEANKHLQALIGD